MQCPTDYGMSQLGGGGVLPFGWRLCGRSKCACMSASLLDWCRASSCVQGSAFCRFSMQGRCGCSQREGGLRPPPLHTDGVFRSRLGPITRPPLHTHAPPRTLKYCSVLSFYPQRCCHFFLFSSLYASSVRFTCLPLHLASCFFISQSKNISPCRLHPSDAVISLGRPLFKKDNSRLLWCTPAISLFPIKPLFFWRPVICFSQKLFSSRSPVRNPGQLMNEKLKRRCWGMETHGGVAKMNGLSVLQHGAVVGVRGRGRHPPIRCQDSVRHSQRVKYYTCYWASVVFLTLKNESSQVASVAV